MDADNVKEIISLVAPKISLGEIIKNLPPELISKISGLVTLLKAIGIIFLCYLIFKIIKSFFDIRRNIRIAKTYYKVNEIDRILDLFLGKKGIKMKSEDKEKSDKKKKSKR